MTASSIRHAAENESLRNEVLLEFKTTEYSENGSSLESKLDEMSKLIIRLDAGSIEKSNCKHDLVTIGHLVDKCKVE